MPHLILAIKPVIEKVVNNEGRKYQRRDEIEKWLGFKCAIYFVIIQYESIVNK
jgi:hypothetical protein